MTAEIQPLVLDSTGWLRLLGYFLSLSLLAVGGAIATAPDMHRHLVIGQSWLNDAQFSSSIAIAQAAPGPNVLFIALIGWNIGHNAAASLPALPVWLVAGLCSAVCMIGALIPSCILTWSATRWIQHHQHLRAVRAFRWGMAPLVVGLVLATGWILAHGTAYVAQSWGPWLVAIVVMLLVWKTRLHLLWMLAAGAAAGIWLQW